MLGDRSEKCSECGEYFADWVDDKGLRLEGARAPKKVVRLVRPCACALIEMDRKRDDLGERREGERSVLVEAASPMVAGPAPP